MIMAVPQLSFLYCNRFSETGALPLPLWDRDERSSLSRVGVRGYGLSIVHNPSPGSHLSMRSDLSHKGRGEGQITPDVKQTLVIPNPLASLAPRNDGQFTPSKSRLRISTPLW